MRFLLIFFVISTFQIARADVLHLSNGDKIEGTKLHDEGDVMVWKSPVLGTLRIPQSSVKQIDKTILNMVITETPAGKESLSTLTSNKLQSVAIVKQTQTSSKVDDAQQAFALTDVNIDFSGKKSSGNDNESSYSVDVDGKFRHSNHRHFVKSEYDVRKEDDVKTQDKQLLGYKYNYLFEGPWLAYLSATREKDKLSDLQERLTGSAGPGYEFYDTDTLRLVVEMGLAHTREDFRRDEDRKSWGWLYGLDWRWLMGETGVELFHNHSLLQSFDTTSDWKIETESGMRFRLIGNLKAVLKLKYDYDNLPAEDKEKTDRTWIVGASYGW